MPRTVANAMVAPRFGVFAAGVLQSGDEVSFDSFTVDGPDPVNAAPVRSTTRRRPRGHGGHIEVLANDTDADEDAELSWSRSPTRRTARLSWP